MKRLEEYCDQLSEKANDADLFYKLKSEICFIGDAIDIPSAEARYESFRRDIFGLARYGYITLNDLTVLCDYASDLLTETIRRLFND